MSPDLVDGWALGPREVESVMCGVFLLREPRGEGDELFPHLPRFTTPAELSDQLQWALANPDARSEAVRKAQAAVEVAAVVVVPPVRERRDELLDEVALCAVDLDAVHAGHLEIAQREIDRRLGGADRRERRGAVLGLQWVSDAEFPQNRAEILTSYALGDTVVLHEKVARSPESDPFEVMSIYSFADGKVDRVEFIR
mgnify:CR=1 FL=1